MGPYITLWLAIDELGVFGDDGTSITLQLMGLECLERERTGITLGMVVATIPSSIIHVYLM